MRVAILFVQLCFLLLSGKNYYLAAQNSAGLSGTHLEQNHSGKVFSAQGFVGLDDDSYDSEEEHGFGDDNLDAPLATLPDFTLASNVYYLLASPELLKNAHNRPRVTSPVLLPSCPKYIVQRVIRI